MQDTYTIQGPPIPWSAPQRSGNFFYSPRSVQKAKKAWEVRLMGTKTFKGPIKLIITFYMPIPKSTPKKLREKLVGDTIPHIKKPDISNLEKFFLDVLEVAEVYKNDSQVYEMQAKKLYSDNPRTVVVVEEISV